MEEMEEEEMERTTKKIGEEGRREKGKVRRTRESKIIRRRQENVENVMKQDK